MTDRAAEIARGLTEAQRRVMFSGLAPSGVGKWPVQNALIGKGLADYFPWRLTPLGLAVREYLQGNPHDD